MPGSVLVTNGNHVLPHPCDIPWAKPEGTGMRVIGALLPESSQHTKD